MLQGANCSVKQTITTLQRFQAAEDKRTIYPKPLAKKSEISQNHITLGEQQLCSCKYSDI